MICKSCNHKPVGDRMGHVWFMDVRLLMFRLFGCGDLMEDVGSRVSKCDNLQCSNVKCKQHSNYRDHRQSSMSYRILLTFSAAVL